MYIVYILESLSTKRRYIGHTKDLPERLLRHNRGAVRSTRSGKPWKVIYTEACAGKSAACLRERTIKGYKGGVQLKALLAGTLRKL